MEKPDESQLTKQQLKNRKKKEAAKKKKQQQQKDNDIIQNESYQEKEKDTVSNKIDEKLKLTENNDDNFEEELCWCVQQIEIGLRTHKATNDQASKSKKLLTQLRSTKTPKPKKRMLMKTNFGNYREKMAKDLHKASMSGTPAKIVEVKEDVMKKSVFVKKKVNDLPPQASASAANNNEMFCFNFPDPT